MVLLTMTPAIVAAIHICEEDRDLDQTKLQVEGEPTLADPEVGKPISHSQIINIAKILKEKDHVCDGVPHRLSDLLRGSHLYTPPPPPKPAQTEEYKALMARLRKEQEAQSYAQMIDPQPSKDFLRGRYSQPSMPAFSAAPAMPPSQDDEATFQDVNRQLTLIINVLVTVVACAISIWIMARYWTVPWRLALSMSGSGLIGVAEVVIYSGYIRRVNEAKSKEKRLVEKKEIMDTWVIERKDGAKVKTLKSKQGASGVAADALGLRKRREG